MKTVKIGKFHILESIISGFMDFCSDVSSRLTQCLSVALTCIMVSTNAHELCVVVLFYLNK